jgi:hypothetical protein
LEDLRGAVAALESYFVRAGGPAGPLVEIHEEVGVDADSVSAAALRANTANWPHLALGSRAHFEIGRGDFDLARAHLEAALASVREDVRSRLEHEPIAVELAL